MRQRTDSDHQLVQSTIRLEPILAWENETALRVEQDELNLACVNFLMDITDIQNTLIQENHDTLPHRDNDSFGTKWARDNIKGTTKTLIPHDYIEKYWTLTGCKIEAARIILAWQHRRDLAQWFQTTDWQGSFTEAKTALKAKWLNHQLYTNVKASHKMPNTPTITSPRFPFNQMNNQVVQQITYQDILWLHNIAIGDTRYDIVFDAAPIWRRYCDVIEVSRPTLFMQEDAECGYKAIFDFTVTENVTKQQPSNHHAIGFDRNMDHARIISGARVNCDGTVSRELGPSVRTLKLCQEVRVRQVELERKREKLSRLMPWQDRKHEVLEADIHDLIVIINRLHDVRHPSLVDRRGVHDGRHGALLRRHMRRQRQLVRGGHRGRPRD